jgi:hypothetical protein
MTGSPLSPDEGRSRQFPRYRKSSSPSIPVLHGGDYGESWELRAVCDCGTRWDAMAGRRSASRRFGPIYADMERHVHAKHAVFIRSVRFQCYNSKLVATHIATALMSALDQIA